MAFIRDACFCVSSQSPSLPAFCSRFQCRDPGQGSGQTLPVKAKVTLMLFSWHCAGGRAPCWDMALCEHRQAAWASVWSPERCDSHISPDLLIIAESLQFSPAQAFPIPTILLLTQVRESVLPMWMVRCGQLEALHTTYPVSYVPSTESAVSVTLGLKCNNFWKFQFKTYVLVGASSWRLLSFSLSHVLSSSLKVLVILKAYNYRL